MQKISLVVIALIMTLTVSAQNPKDCKAGQLATLIEDCNITSLELKGHMDARDFRFIADSLRQLTHLDLGEITIDAYRGETLFGNVNEYAAGEVPCQALASMLELQTLVLPQGATRLGDGCMAGCPKLATVQFPAGLKRIGDYALSGCIKLTGATATTTLAHIGDGAFSNCTALQSFVIGEPADTDSTRAAALSLNIGARAFANCPALRTVDLGNLVKTMGSEVLAETGLQQLDLSSHSQLDTLPDWALTNTALRQLTLPANVRVIGDGALMNDDNISQLTLPATVGYIGSHAMAYMNGLKQLESKPTDVPALGDSVWYGIDQSTVVLKVSPQSLADYRAAPQWCNFAMASFRRGDVNADGVVDIADVNIVINIMLGRDSADNYDGRAYITENDTNVDIADVNAVINLMLARLRAMRLAAARAAAQAATSH